MADEEIRPEPGAVASSVERLRHEFDRWLEAAFEQGGRALNAIGIRGSSRPFHPAADVVESGDDILVCFDLPGVDPGSIELTLTGNMLTVRGEKPPAPSGEGRTLHSAERPHGEFVRSVPMPVPVNPEAIDASARDGVLTVRLVKSDRARARQIRVSTGGGS